MLNPVFLVGSERSGTTLLRLMLDHHPEIAFNLESEFLVTRISDEGEFPDIAEYRTFLRDDRVFSHSRFEIREELDFAGLLDDFLEQKRSRDGKSIVGATVHYQFRKLSLIWPEAKYIYLYRDGRDVAQSVVQMGWAGNVYAGADWWLEAEIEWERHRHHIAADAWIEVRYEDLLSDPVGQLERICRFIGVDYSDLMFGYVDDTSYKVPDASLAYQWKKRMGRHDVRMLEEKLGQRLVSRGYELSGHPALSVSGFRKALLYLHSKISKFAFRVKRYGAPLVLRGMISRRLGLNESWRRVNLELSRIDDAMLK